MEDNNSNEDRDARAVALAAHDQIRAAAVDEVRKARLLFVATIAEGKDVRAATLASRLGSPSEEVSFLLGAMGVIWETLRDGLGETDAETFVRVMLHLAHDRRHGEAEEGSGS